MCNVGYSGITQVEHVLDFYEVTSSLLVNVRLKGCERDPPLPRRQQLRESPVEASSDAAGFVLSILSSLSLHTDLCIYVCLG